jgi:hypothetical protein
MKCRVERNMNRNELQFGRDMPQAAVPRSTSEYEVEALLFRVVTLGLLSSFLEQSPEDVRYNASLETYNSVAELRIKIVKARLECLYFFQKY